MEEDAYAIRSMAHAGVSCLVSNSFSKIFSLYGERVGGLSVVCHDEHTADKVLGQLKATIRQNYSSPPRHGAQIVSAVLAQPELKSSWIAEVETMRLRIVEMRKALVARLSTALPDRDFSFFLTQQGMFSYTGLNADQVMRLKVERRVYLIGSGRICMSGLNPQNIDQVAEAMARTYGIRECA